MNSLSFAGLTCLMASGLAAQSMTFEHCASLDNTEHSGFQREAGVGSTVAYQAIISNDDFFGWGFTAGNESFATLGGVRVLLGDIDSSSAEQVDIWVYPESATNPGSPDLSNPAAAYSYNLFGNGNPGQMQAFRFELPFPTPAEVSATGDIFIEIYLDGAVAPEVHVGVLAGDQIAPTLTTYDIANARTDETGHGDGASGGYGYVINQATQLAFFLESQILAAPMAIDQAGLALGAQTTQTTLPGSNAPGMSASFFSALHPCDVVDRNGDTRLDNVGWFFNGPYGPSDTVLIRGTTTGFLGTPIDLGLFLPGSIGGLCLDTTFPFLDFGSMTPDADGNASTVLTIPAAARGGIAGFSFTYQCFVLDFVQNVVHATGCAQQRW